MRFCGYLPEHFCRSLVDIRRFAFGCIWRFFCVRSNLMKNSYPRDFHGYGEKASFPYWPNDARVAISIVVNVEAGSELSLADGDEKNESVYEIIEPVEGVPNFCLNSHFDYGPRVGWWRIMQCLEKYNIPCTISAAGRAIERCPWIAEDAVRRGHEIAAHGYR